MTGNDLKKWRKRMRLNVSEAAQALGVSPDTYARYERRPEVDRCIALACAAISFGLPPAIG